MQVGSLAGPVYTLRTDTVRAMLAAFEGAGNIVARQVTGVHVVHGSQCLLVRGAGCLRGVTCHGDPPALPGREGDRAQRLPELDRLIAGQGAQEEPRSASTLTLEASRRVVQPASVRTTTFFRGRGGPGAARQPLVLRLVDQEDHRGSVDPSPARVFLLGNGASLSMAISTAHSRPVIPKGTMAEPVSSDSRAARA